MWVFDVQTRRMVGGSGKYPVKLNTVFGSAFPRDIDAAFQQNGVAFFFKGKLRFCKEWHKFRVISLKSDFSRNSRKIFQV